MESHELVLSADQNKALRASAEKNLNAAAFAGDLLDVAGLPALRAAVKSTSTLLDDMAVEALAPVLIVELKKYMAMGQKAALDKVFPSGPAVGDPVGEVLGEPV